MIPRPKHPLAFLPVSMGFLVLLLTLFLTVLKVTSLSPTATQNPGAQAGGAGATLAISPASDSFSFQPGSVYHAGVLLNSNETLVKRVDLRIKFDPAAVRVGSKLASGSILDNYALLEVDNNRGIIFITAENFEPRKAEEILASFSYVPVKKGDVDFTIEYDSPGRLDDSNVINANGRDVLTTASPAKYSFQ